MTDIPYDVEYISTSPKSVSGILEGLVYVRYYSEEPAYSEHRALCLNRAWMCLKSRHPLPHRFFFPNWSEADGDHLRNFCKKLQPYLTEDFAIRLDLREQENIRRSWTGMTPERAIQELAGDPVQFDRVLLTLFLENCGYEREAVERAVLSCRAALRII